MTAAERWRSLSSDLRASVNTAVTRKRRGDMAVTIYARDLALIEAVLERVQVSVMDDQGIPDPRTAADILAELERAP